MSTWIVKGPWYFVKHNWEATSIYDADREPVCTININPDVTEETQDRFEAITAAKADAIAALPDLMEAAEPIANRDTGRLQGTVSVPLAEIIALRSALLKAKGGEQ